MDEENFNAENNEKLENIKKINKKFIIKFIIFLIILILITCFAIYFTIKYLDENSENVIHKETETEEIKKTAEDSKYALKSYTETYNSNSLKIIDYYDIDGEIETENKYHENSKSNINFIQIEGLKNKNIQNQINEELKQKAYNLKDTFVYTNVTASFSNILSVYISNENGQVETINIDLSTGEDIPFEKVFISSATLNSYLADGLYKTLAWQNLEITEETVKNDMDNVDTSEYEDEFIKLINNYNKSKDNLKFNIYSSSISIYELINKDILDIDGVESLIINIDLVEHINEVAIYKRYLTENSIFEDDSLGLKDTIVLTGYFGDEKYITRLSYGKLTENIFMEEILFRSDEDNEGIEYAEQYVKKLSEEQKETLKRETDDNKATFFQREYNIFYDTNKEYFIIDVRSYQAMCPIAYFQEEAFKDYIKLKAMPRADVGLNGFNEYMREDFPNLQILNEKFKSYYINASGEFLGNTEEEVNKKIEEKQLINQVQNKIDENIQEEQQNYIQEENIVNNVIDNNLQEEIENEILENNALLNDVIDS